MVEDSGCIGKEALGRERKGEKCKSFYWNFGGGAEWMRELK
jgi:hypothetical protein